MNKEAKYGILFIALLLIVVPAVFLLIKASIALFGLMLFYPGYCLTAILGAFAGSALTKLSK